MKLCWISLVFGLAFLTTKLVDIAVSSSDVFGWIITIDKNCNLANKDGVIISKDPLTWIFFGISALITGFFGLVFCCSCFLGDKDYIPVDLSKLKLFLEIFIIAGIFDPVSNVKLLLRDCLAGYLMVGTVAATYSLAVFIAVAFVDIGFWHRNQCIYIMFNFLVTICQSIQVVTCLFAFGMFFGFAMKMDNSVKYSYLAVTIVVSVSVWVKNTMERMSFQLSSRNKYKKKNKCCFKLPKILIAVNFLCFVFLIVILIISFQSNRGTLFVISLTFLLISAFINFCYILREQHNNHDEDDDY